MRQLKRYNPKGSKYERKTIDKHGREVVKPFKKEDYEEMQRVLRVRMESLEKDSDEYFRPDSGRLSGRSDRQTGEQYRSG